MAIMLIVTSVLLVRQSKFDSSTLLRSLAYSVALSVRQAQVYGTSVFGTTTTSSYCNTGTYQNGSCFAQGYGIYVSSAAPTSYILFADLNNNGTYNTGEDVRVYTLGNGYVISDFCATEAAGGAIDCWRGGVGLLGSSPPATMSIVFRRPNPEACFTTNLSPSTCAMVPSGTLYKSASIQIQFTGGDTGSTRSIYINSTGQISVGNSGT